MKRNELVETLNELHRIFGILNDNFFNGELEQPVITIQKSRSTNLGHFTLSKIWENVDTKELKYEININPIHLDRPVEEIVGTLLHEAIHYYHKVNDIKDATNNVHNKKFKNKAEELGFIVERSKKYGYGHTTLSPELKDYIDNEIQPRPECFMYFMNIPMAEEKEAKTTTKKTFKYICEKCGMEVKAKPEMNILCGNCQITLEMEED